MRNRTNTTMGKKRANMLFASALSATLMLGIPSACFAAGYEAPYDVPELTGDWRTDFIAVAESQIGYTEAADGSSYFGAWAGQTYRPWCSEFVAWCADQAGIPASVIPLGKSTSTYRSFFVKKGRYYYLDEGIDGASTSFMKSFQSYDISTISTDDLEPGDIILTETNGSINDGPDHTAIFLNYDSGWIEYVSGNSNDCVEIAWCAPDEVHGVCKPNFGSSSAGSSSSKTTTSTASASNAEKSSSGSSSRSSGKKSSGSSSSGGSSSGSSSTKSGTLGTSSLPSYVVKGNWTNLSGKFWMFTDSSGKPYSDQWAAVYNPYADTAAGQSSYDWFYFKGGFMQIGWVHDEDGNQYYLNPDSDGTLGAMKTGWAWIADKTGTSYCYYFNPVSDGFRGKKMTGTVIDGYELDELGRWVVDGVPQTREQAGS